MHCQYFIRKLSTYKFLREKEAAQNFWLFGKKGWNNYQKMKYASSF